MKKMTYVLFILAVFLSPLILSCSSDNDVNPIYDLRTLSRVSEEFGTTTKNQSFRSTPRKPRVPILARSDQDITPGNLSAFKQTSTTSKETYTYEYDYSTHLYWTKATGTDALGNIVATATQTLDYLGFPSRRMWYDGEGNFDNAYDYTYHSTLYLRTSTICYIDDPTDNPDARRYYEDSITWNNDGVQASSTGIEYDSNGIKIYEYKWRSTILKNALRGAGGFGYYEDYKEYEEGLLTYQEKLTFDSDGYPQTYEDTNGDGTYEETGYTEITKTVEGYLESVIWVEDSTGDQTWKTTFAYDKAGLLKSFNGYEVVGGEFVLDSITTVVWYENPVNGPTGGLMISFASDEAGKPSGAYETVDWAVAQMIHHYYAAIGEEASRITDSLEKTRLQ